MITDLIQPIELKARVYLNSIADIVLNNDADKENAVMLLKDITEYKKAISSQKKELTAPLKSQVKDIEDKFKKPIEFLDEADSTLRTKINTYLDNQRIRIEQETLAKKQLIEDKAIAEVEKLEALKSGAGDYDEVTRQALIQSIEDKQNTLINDTAKSDKVNLSSSNSVVRTVWDFELVDLSVVPLEFLQLDEKKVREAIKKGIHDIKGVKIFQRSQVAIK